MRSDDARRHAMRLKQTGRVARVLGVVCGAGLATAAAAATTVAWGTTTSAPAGTALSSSVSLRRRHPTCWRSAATTQGKPLPQC